MRRDPNRPFKPWTRLEDARLDANLTIRDLAVRVERSEVHMRQVLDGRVGVSDELLFKLADIFKIAPSELERTRPSIPPRGSVRRPPNVAAQNPMEVAS